MASRINLSDRVINQAFMIFKNCHENKYVRGHSQDAVIAACVYIACRQHSAQRTIKGKNETNPLV